MSAWRVSDVVAYDLMRGGATRLTALLLSSADADPGASAGATGEVAQLRHDVLTVDGYDRAEVQALALRINKRIDSLARRSR